MRRRTGTHRTDRRTSRGGGGGGGRESESVDTFGIYSRSESSWSSQTSKRRGSGCDAVVASINRK